MERRTFLWLSAAGLMVPFVNCTGEPAASDALAQPLSLSYINDAATISQLGESYRKLVSNEAKAGKLVRLLLANADGHLVSQEDSVQLQNFLAQKIQNDYKTEKTVIVDGWILSVTEARQCALFSLTQ